MQKRKSRHMPKRADAMARRKYMMPYPLYYDNDKVTIGRRGSSYGAGHVRCRIGALCAVLSPHPPQELFRTRPPTAVRRLSNSDVASRLPSHLDYHMVSSGTHNHIRPLSYYSLYLPDINIVKNAEIGGLNSGLLHAIRIGCAIVIQLREG